METLLAALRAAGEATRLRLLALCAHSDLTVSELVQILGQSQPRISRHLKLLCEAGLLERNREGSWAYFRLPGRGSVAEFGRQLVDSIPGDDPTLALDLERLQAIIDSRAALAADYFKRNAAKWDEIRSLYVDDAEVEALLLELLPPGGVGDHLDIGTGTGRILELLASRSGRSLGIDLSHEMLLVARSKLERAGLRNCAVRHGDMYQLPIASEAFDLVTLHQVLHYAERPEAVIAEAARVLRPGGRLVLVDFAEHGEQALRDEHAHRWLGFKDEDLADWFAAAGLGAVEADCLPGTPLTVCLWSADRPANQAAAPAA